MAITSNPSFARGPPIIVDICLPLVPTPWNKIILDDSCLTQTYIEYLEQTLVYKMQRECEFQIMSATERYISFRKKYRNIEKRVNQSYIASYLGITPESLSRIRRTIKEEN